jgi:hypothetical protein
MGRPGQLEEFRFKNFASLLSGACTANASTAGPRHTAPPKKLASFLKFICKPQNGLLAYSNDLSGYERTILPSQHFVTGAVVVDGREGQRNTKLPARSL